MANGIGSVWAANYGEDGKPNGVGSVWIANASALVPSGGASEEQISALSAAIDYVSANAGDQEVNQSVHTNSATWNTVTDKLDTSSFSDVSSTFLTAVDLTPYQTTAGMTAYQPVGDYATTTQVNELSGAVDYVSANVGQNIELYNSDQGSTRLYTISSEDTSLKIVGKETTGYIYDNFIYSINQSAALLTGTNGVFEIPFSISGTYPSTSGVFKLQSRSDTSWNFFQTLIVSSNGETTAHIPTSSTLSAFAFNLVDSKGNIISENSIRDIFGGQAYDVYPNCPVTSTTAGYGRLTATNPLSAIVTPGDYKFVISSYDAEMLPSFSGWYSLRSQANDGKSVTATYMSIPAADIAGGSNLWLNNGSDISGTNGSHIKMTNGANVGLSGSSIEMAYSELYAVNDVLRAGQRGTLYASGSRFVSADGEGISAWVAAPMTVLGKYNQTSSNAAFVIGTGSASNSRSDLFVIDYSGNAQTNDFIAGNGAKLSDLTAISASIGDVESLLSSL